jgi:serine/threonine protein phosphatase PrpC
MTPESPLRFESWLATGLGAEQSAQRDAVYRDDARGLYALARTFGGGQAGHEAMAQAVLAAAQTTDPLEARFAQAQAAAHQARQANPGLAAVLTVLDLHAGRLAHVGDALLVLYRGGALHAHTEAHTLANALRAPGEPPSTEVSVLVRALGFERAPKADLSDFGAQAGDTLLLLSGGLARLTDALKLAPVMNAAQPAGAVQWLVNRATEQGAVDNVTALMVRIS